MKKVLFLIALVLFITACGKENSNSNNISTTSSDTKKVTECVSSTGDSSIARTFTWPASLSPPDANKYVIAYLNSPTPFETTAHTCISNVSTTPISYQFFYNISSIQAGAYYGIQENIYQKNTNGTYNLIRIIAHPAVQLL